jgi:hypothetical protein
MRPQLLINQHEHIKVKLFAYTMIYLDEFSLAVADTYIKLSSGFNTLATCDKTNLSQ